jgi:hypothetical protein
VDGEHFDSSDIAAPVASEITIHIVLIIIIMAMMYAEVMDVCGAFLLGEFDPRHKMYMRVPKGFEKFYPAGIVLLLMRTLYGTRQAAMAFWQKLRVVFRYVELLQSKADPCLHFKWDDIMGLMMWLSWVDDLFGAGEERAVKATKEGIKSQMECEETGELQEYVGCKLVRDVAGRTMKLTQPVLIQSLMDEFELPSQEVTIPATSGDVLDDDAESDLLSPAEQTKYRSGVGKLLHLAKWSRVDILNRVRELSKYITSPRESHFKAMCDEICH